MRTNFCLYIISIQILFSLEINILSYNIHGLSPILAGDNPKERIPEILHKSNKFDIILLQENWILSHAEISKELDGYNIVVSNQSKFKGLLKSLLNPNGAGLSIALKDSITLLEFDEYSFSDCSGWIFRYNDCLSTKGFQRISIKIDGERVDLYNTHLDAGKSKKDTNVRVKQLQDLQDYIKLYSSPYALIIVGDMNIDFMNSQSREVIDEFKNQLDLQMIDWFSKLANNTGVVDYIFYRESDTVEITKIIGRVEDDLLGLSDHPPIGAIFDIRRK